ncbi:sigma-70 family RNA polymerase sigma factor [Kribbella qitaiheensis]|uniref:Sigma-70 family RNA polymerase sigma factor n=1 Tax=Kribbella qitaiheensis TaxID=1544730 RepID=A0A7G6WTM1_9ACTN|nr:ECF RNA polymerase sigma factor SigK [Kribbella qitaiheensis]QNE17336.1 sigma-70 family RNA polymerase sigma factor [Kribbella qitaiheensis]
MVEDGTIRTKLLSASPSAARTDPHAAVMARVADGDPAAFTELYVAMVPRVFGLVRRVLRNQAQAEEVTQEVMIDLWRRAARYDEARGSVVSWTLTIAHRRAIDRVRSEQAGARREHRVASWPSIIGGDQVADRVAAGLAAQRLRICLQRLTALQREAITLAYFGGYTYTEVAQLVDASLPAVKARIRDGLRKLRDDINDPPPPYPRRLARPCSPVSAIQGPG